ncbi:MAG: hypothetical protein H7123_03880, partial [Thermoleophilia bacterium]|nr:hypothetical protein [Thermoleophilia bacterium]
MSTSHKPARTSTVGAVLRAARERFLSAGIETAGIDAELLVAHATGLTRVQLRTRDHDELAPDTLAAVEALTVRREA